MLSLSAATQTVLFEEDFIISDIIPPYWTSIDGDGLTPAASVSNFTSAWIGVYIPAGLSEDTCVASTSYYNPAGQISRLFNFSKVISSDILQIGLVRAIL